MTIGRKLKISVSLDADLVSIVDRAAEAEGATRSSVMERWLRQVSRRAKLARLEEETAAYYDAMTAAERKEDDAWAEASSRAARKLRVDDAGAVTADGKRRPAGRRRG